MASKLPFTSVWPAVNFGSEYLWYRASFGIFWSSCQWTQPQTAGIDIGSCHTEKRCHPYTLYSLGNEPGTRAGPNLMGGFAASILTAPQVSNCLELISAPSHPIHQRFTPFFRWRAKANTFIKHTLREIHLYFEKRYKLSCNFWQIIQDL